MSEYKEGYGQAKADVLREVSKAMKLLQEEIHRNSLSFEPTHRPTEEQKKEMLRKIDALRWVRSIVKAQRSPR